MQTLGRKPHSGDFLSRSAKKNIRTTLATHLSCRSLRNEIPSYAGTGLAIGAILPFRFNGDGDHIDLPRRQTKEMALKEPEGK